MDGTADVLTDNRLVIHTICCYNLAEHCRMMQAAI